MARIGWRLEDAVEGTVEIFPINPNEGAAPKYAKQLTKTTTTAGGVQGQVIIFEGADQPIEFSFSGVLLTQQHYEFYYRAWSKRHPVRLTDDLGRTFTIYIESFTPTRVRSRTYPWRHTYQATAVIIDDA